MAEFENKKMVPQEAEAGPQGTNIMETTENMLADVRARAESPETMRIPLGQLAALGSGIAAMLPGLRTVTQDVSFPVDGMYRWINAEAGAVLKGKTENGLYGAFMDTAGKSRMAKFQEVTAVGGQVVTELPIDPVEIAVAAALCSIEKELKSISEMETEIRNFLNQEKEAEIEADVETLCSMMYNYKFNWNNEMFVNGHYNKVLDIQNTARKNMNFYQKQVKEMMGASKIHGIQAKAQNIRKELQKKMKYYRLSLYSFSLASLMEVMFSKNFGQNNLAAIQEEIEKLSMEYRERFSECSAFLEEKSHASLEQSVLKGVGSTSHAMGKLIGSIPVVRNGLVDEHLQIKGEQLKEKAQSMEKDALEEFAAISNPGTRQIVEKLEDLDRIYNRTKEICFDRENIYLMQA